MLAALLNASLAAAQPGTSDSAEPASDHIFYDVSDDPNSLELLALSDAGKVNGKEQMEVINVFRSPKMMMGSTWRFDCTKEQMAIVHQTSVQPGSPVHQADVKPRSISARSSAKAFRLYQLACTGRGDLIERKMYHGELPTIVSRFWSNPAPAAQ